MNFRKAIVEIRFNPDPVFLDVRGEMTQKLLTKDFSNWKIIKDRIEIHGESGVLFFSYMNVGFFTLSENVEPLLDRLDEALKHLGERTPIRWGVRTQSLHPTKKSFDQLLKKFRSNLLAHNSDQLTTLDAKLDDIGITYIFNTDHDKHKIEIGPMDEKQASFFFPNDSIPKTSIFSDIDTYREGKGFYGSDARRSRIFDFVKSSLKTNEAIVKEFIGRINDR